MCEGLPEGLKCLLKGPEGLQVGPEGLSEGPESLSEGSEGGRMYVRTDVQNFSPFYRTVRAAAQKPGVERR